MAQVMIMYITKMRKCLANELIKHKKVFYMLSYPNRSHGIREDDAYPHVRLMFTDFLRKNCPPGGR